MPDQKAKEPGRVSFDRGLPANIMAIDGTWRRACTVCDVSDVDATLIVEGSVQGLNLTEFFLLLSSTGLAYRRCRLERINGDMMTVSFLKLRGNKKVGNEPADMI
jgi:hypothetical protein